MYLHFQHLIDSFENREGVYSRMYDGERYCSTTYHEFYRHIKSIAHYLAVEKKFQKGDKVALMSENRPEWMTMYMGIVYNGIVAVPFDAMLSVEEVKNLIKNSKVTTIGVSSSIYEKLQSDSEIKDIIKQWIIFDELKDSNANIATLKDIFHKYSPELPQRNELKKNDLASLIYTSGTTGSPKAVMLSNGNFMHQVNNLWLAADLMEEDIVLSVLPLHHTFQFSVELTMLGIGAQITYADSIKPNRLIDCIQSTKVTIMIGIPTLYGKILEGIQRKLNDLKGLGRIIIHGLLKLTTLHYKITRSHKAGEKVFKFLRKKAGLDSVKFMISGAAPLSPSIAEGYAALGFKMANGYGLTESSPVISVGNPNGYIDNFSVGNAIPKVSWKILDAGPDGIGEICVRGENVMQGYYENPRATAEMFTEDGWLKTGDMGYIGKHKDSEYLYITGRYKNIIVTGGGKNVYPEEIEEIINAHPYILESIVIGVTPNDQDMSEFPCALIVVNVPKLEADNIDPQDPSVIEAIQNHMKEINNTKLQSYQQLRGYRILHEELVKNSTRKIKRFEYKGKNYRDLLK